MTDALDGNGSEITRRCRVIGDLPHSLRLAALKSVSDALDVPPLSFGVPCYVTLGLKRSDAINDHRADWLMLKGCDMPLQLIPPAKRNQPMTEYCTYTTDLNSDAIALTRAEFEAMGGLPDDWADYIWQEAETREIAVAMHHQRHDEYMAYQAGMNVEDYINHG